MSDLFIHSQGNLLSIETDSPVAACTIRAHDGQIASCPTLLNQPKPQGGFLLRLDASSLNPWTPESPTLYTLTLDNHSPVRFGHAEIRTFNNSAILINGVPSYLRGYIRGITAHDHPNMTGLSLREACRKNIAQAKKYGFNLVRFHSTVPSPEFVEAADELGLLIHAEIGFAYEYDDQGRKQKLAMDNQNWVDVIRRYRNHPSLAIFCIGNEMHRAGHQPQVHKLYALGKQLAPNKLIMDNSGWGEYDRPSADIFSQHIAYFFPFKHHATMFNGDHCWHMNGSTFDAPMQQTLDNVAGQTRVRRHATPLKPVLAHEAIHYIDIPDYEALNRKFDAFAQRVGNDYLAENQIEKPRYLTALPELIRQKNLQDIYPDYIQTSQKFKRDAIKIYLETLRLAPLCGYEMLQFADCLKYENKNGIVDFFDDDKFIDPAWMRQFNADSVLLAQFPENTLRDDAPLRVSLFASHFAAPANLRGDLVLTLLDDGRETTLYNGPDFVLVNGLQKLVDLELVLPPLNQPRACQLLARFTTPGVTLTNAWEFWRYPQPQLGARPQVQTRSALFADFVAALPARSQLASSLLIRDRLDDDLLDQLGQGRTVLLCYHRDEENQYYWPGALDRYKPCIWDRGSNLGLIIKAPWLQQALAVGRYAAPACQPLIENAYKINLDDFPVRPDELANMADKPVRDRMKGLIHGVRDFIATDTLRRFSHLFALRVGAGKLIVCTFNKNACRQPAAASAFAAIIDQAERLEIQASLEVDALRRYLREQTAAGIRKEDVMNHFWEIDNKPVEDTLFWEEAGINLKKIK